MEGKLMKSLIATILCTVLTCTASYAMDDLSIQSPNATANSTSEAQQNLKAGNTFLTKNKLNKGVVTLPDGLQYKILKKGKGPKPNTTDTVIVDYEGRFINGDKFDSSYDRHEPATFPVSGVIPGWTEALLLMPVGSKWELYIPADLAYGNDAPPSIGPNKTLLFTVELKGIQKP